MRSIAEIRLIHHRAEKALRKAEAEGKAEPDTAAVHAVLEWVLEPGPGSDALKRLTADETRPHCYIHTEEEEEE